MKNKSKIRVRVPRAYNISALKIIINALIDIQEIDDLISKLDFLKTTHFNEYLILLQRLGWVTKKTHILRLTARGKEIKNNFKNSKELSDSEKKEYLKDFLLLDFVKNFIVNVFDYDGEIKVSSTKCLTISEMEDKYQAYRQIGKQASDREARVIYNWLSTLGLLESINFIDTKKSAINVCYHLVKNQLTFEEFSKLIRIVYIKISNSNLQNGNLLEVEWINIPTIRRLFCSNYNISTDVFNEYFKKFVEKNSSVFQLASGSLLRNEVEREGIEINNRIIFYIRLTEGDFNE
jgi:hypothetical protein